MHRLYLNQTFKVVTIEFTLSMRADELTLNAGDTAHMLITRALRVTMEAVNVVERQVKVHLYAPPLVMSVSPSLKYGSSPACPSPSFL